MFAQAAIKSLLALALALLVAIIPPCTSLGLLRKFQSRNLLQMDNETQVLNKLFTDTNSVGRSMFDVDKLSMSLSMSMSFSIPFLNPPNMSSIPLLINETDDWIAYEDAGADAAAVDGNTTKPYSLIRLDKPGSGRILAGAAMLTGAALAVVLAWRAAKHAAPRRD